MKILFNTLILSGISLFTFGQVNIKTNLPASIAPNSVLTIEIKINKGSISNFSKYQMDVPTGVTITEGNSKTGNFSFENNRAKIVWVSIPPEPEFFVSFKMNVGSINGSGVFNQKFFYLENGSKKEVEIDSVNVNFNSSGATAAISFPELAGSNYDNTNTSSINTPTIVAGNTNTTSTNTSGTTSDNTNTTVNTKTVETIVEPTFEQKLDALNKKHSGQIGEAENKSIVKEVKQSEKTNTPEKVTSNAGLIFRIQLASSAVSPSKVKFSSLGKIDISNEAGLYKVLYGNYNSKEEALKKLEEIKAKGFDGFIVRYQDGARVK